MTLWKTPDKKPDTDQHVLFFAGGGIFPYLGFYYPKFDTFNDWKSKDIQRWASVFEVIDQADKVERLQKAVDYALDTLKKAETTRELTVKGHYVHAISLDELHSVLKEIKQLIKGE